MAPPKRLAIQWGFLPPRSAPIGGSARTRVACASVRECHMSVGWRGRKVGGVEMVLLDALAPGGRLASFSDFLEISLV